MCRLPLRRRPMGVWPMRRTAAVIAALAMIAALSCPAAVAADARAGRAKALACQACHGLDGLSKVPDAPNIAGQNESYIAAQLRAFRAGARRNESMSVVASALSDGDIDNLAAYYAAIEIRIVKIPGE
jgi:cytochrome c553